MQQACVVQWYLCECALSSMMQLESASGHSTRDLLSWNYVPCKCHHLVSGKSSVSKPFIVILPALKSPPKDLLSASASIS